MKRLDQNEIIIDDSEILAFSCVRNELLRLPYFLEYHRELGVDRFIFVDNASTDGTTDYLLNQDDSIVFYTEDSYAGSRCGIDWLNELITEYGTGHWILTVDADEMLIYPECESVNLQMLTAYLDSVGANAMKTFLVDMYSDKAIKDTYYESGKPFLGICSYFDGDSYTEYDQENFPIRGGPRHRIFWDGYNREKKSPFLINIPLIKWQENFNYEIGTHVIKNLNLALLTGGKLHFKFFSDFYTYAESEAARNEHWDNAAQYKSYWEVLRENPDLSAIYDGSVKYKESMQVVELGFMKLPEDYFEFVKKHDPKKNRSLFFKFLRPFRS